MSSTRIVQAVYLFEDRHLSRSLRLPRMTPDQFRFDGLEGRLNGGVIITISLAAHQYLEAMLAQDLLVIVRTLLVATIRVMDAALRWCSECDCHFQCTDRQVAFHAVTDHCPAGFAPHGPRNPSRPSPRIRN